MRHYTPAELADRWACSTEHVHRQIRNGRLRAFSISPPGSKRPRWRIALDAVLAYESANAAHPPTKPSRQRRRRQPEVIQFFA